METQLAYWAGLIDGEGCFSMHTQTRAPTLSFGSTYEPAIRKFSNHYGVTVYHRHLKSGKDFWWVYIIRKATLVCVLEQLLPYLDIKKAEAESTLLFFRGT